MWRNNEIDVNKMLRRPLNKKIIFNLNQYNITYPHIKHTLRNKLWSNKRLKRVLHIFTPLIIIIIYI